MWLDASKPFSMYPSVMSALAHAESNSDLQRDAMKDI